MVSYLGAFPFGQDAPVVLGFEQMIMVRKALSSTLEQFLSTVSMYYEIKNVLQLHCCATGRKIVPMRNGLIDLATTNRILIGCRNHDSTIRESAEKGQQRPHKATLSKSRGI